MATYDFRIATGWNVALGSLTNVESLPKQSGFRFLPPAVAPGYDPGQEAFAGDGSDYFQGFPMVPWFMGNFRYPLWYYFFNTLNAGLYRNKVTIYTLTVPGLTTYTRYNAWMYLPKPQHRASEFGVLPDYTIYMTGLVAL